MGRLESMTKARAIHRPPGYIKLHRSLLTHFAEERITPQEWMVFTVLILTAGWEKERANYARVEANAARIAKEWLPNWTRQYVAKIVNSLIEKGYVSKDGPWWLIPKYEKYNANNRETIVSQTDDLEQGRETIVSTRETPVSNRETIVSRPIVETRTNTESETPLKEVRNKKENNPPVVPQRFNVLRAFDKWWDAYPRKSHKPEARELWKDICHDQETFDQLLKTLEWQKTSEGWTKDGGRWIPNPAKYLDEEKYEERPIEVTPKPQSAGGVIGWPYWKQWGFNSFEECQAWEAEQQRQREAGG